jgi:type II secretory pathway pseudopilin PulG
MLTAIIVIIIIGSLLVYTLNISSATTRQTSDLYAKEQVQILARSATEYTLLQISGTDYSTGCYNGEVFTYNGFDINTSVSYIGTNFSTACARVLADPIATDESNGTAIIDVTVTYADDGKLIRYHRRTLQKP